MSEHLSEHKLEPQRCSGSVSSSSVSSSDDRIPEIHLWKFWQRHQRHQAAAQTMDLQIQHGLASTSVESVGRPISSGDGSLVTSRQPSSPGRLSVLLADHSDLLRKNVLYVKDFNEWFSISANVLTVTETL